MHACKSKKTSILMPCRVADSMTGLLFMAYFNSYALSLSTALPVGQHCQIILKMCQIVTIWQKKIEKSNKNIHYINEIYDNMIN